MKFEYLEIRQFQELKLLRKKIYPLNLKSCFLESSLNFLTG